MNKDLREMHKKRMTGKGNPRWNGGTSEYPNHILLKKNRIKLLERNNGKCEICGENAETIHHKDFSKNNHNLNNLMVLCNLCHRALHKAHRKKYLNSSLLNLRIKEAGLFKSYIAKKMGVSGATISYWCKGYNYPRIEKVNKLKEILNINKLI